MKILQRYIGKSLFFTFITTLLVLIGILCLGNLIRIADLIIKGMDPLMIFKFLYYLIVGLLEYAIPMAILTATLLVFGRLSSDNEITAMRASGIGLTFITLPAFLLALLLTLFCVYLQNTVIPNYNFATRKLKSQIGLKDPDLLLEPGEFVRLPGYAIRIDDRKSGLLENILIHQYDGGRLVSTIMASRGKIESQQGKDIFILDLYDGTMEEYDPDNRQISTRTSFGYLKHPVSLKALVEEQENLQKRAKDMTRTELLSWRRELIQEEGRTRTMISMITTELHQKLSMALACFSFVMIAIPLAIKAHRGEKSIGMALSLILMFIFYIFIMYAKAVAEVPQRYPHLIIWFPNLLYCGVGLFWMVKFTRI